MRLNIRKRSLPKPARSKIKREHEKPDKPGIEMCKICNAIFYRKRWYADINSLRAIPKNTRINYIYCPACIQKKNKVFEGEVIIEGIDPKIFEEIIRRIENIEKDSRLKNPMARILDKEFKISSGKIRITTSENQLARHIARLVSEAFGGKYILRFSKEESTLRAYVNLSK